MPLKPALLWQNGRNVVQLLTILLVSLNVILLVQMWMPMKPFSGFSMACNRLYRPGFARSNPRTFRQPYKLPNKLARCLRLQLLQVVATNHTSVMFPLPCLLPLICGCRLCPWSWVARAFLARATTVARLGIGLLTAGCRGDRSLPNQLPTGPIKIRANFKLVKANLTMHS